MYTSHNVIQAAQLRRRDILAEAARERQIDAALAGIPASRPTVDRHSAADAPAHAVLATVRCARSLLTSLATFAFGVAVK
jgi:hypothetical protein